jgi:Flp pilus assembly protein TadG
MVRSREEGAAAVEFALLLPVIFLLVFGIIDFGFWLNQKITATDAARQGLRTYVYWDKPAEKVEKGLAVIRKVTGVNITDYAFSDCTALGTTGVKTAHVRFSYDSKAMINLPGLSSTTISGTADIPCVE